MCKFLKNILRDAVDREEAGKLVVCGISQLAFTALVRNNDICSSYYLSVIFSSYLALYNCKYYLQSFRRLSVIAIVNCSAAEFCVRRNVIFSSSTYQNYETL